MTTAAALRQQALDRARAGDDAGAARLFDAALAQFPRDAALANSAGNFHAGAGRPDAALALFDRALAIAPQSGEAVINRAITLPRLGRAAEAAADLRSREAAMGGDPRYWRVRAAAELAAGDPAAAARSYDAALARAPADARALSGRAQAALEAGDDAAVGDHERAIATVGPDPFLLKGYAFALQAAGRLDDALAIAAALVARAPGWVPALEQYATLRRAAGDRTGFTDHFADAAAAVADPAVHRSWAAMLAGVDRHAEAAEVLLGAHRTWPADAALALAAAAGAGDAGDDASAAALFAALRRDDRDRQVAEARFRLQTGEPARAEALLATILDADPADVAAWSLRDVVWRLLGDARHDWLHGQDGMIRPLELQLEEDALDRIRAGLDTLHDRASLPIGQSVREGTQTRGALFQRTEPEVATIARAIDRAIATYRAGLPPADPTHPLLRRTGAWRVVGSWSIRLDGTGHHAAHIHPEGIVSSAAYVTVPAGIDAPEQPGWLELGRPPRELRQSLPPVATIRPRAGWCVLFPSTLFHGTRPIRAGRRMSVAFDVAEAP